MTPDDTVLTADTIRRAVSDAKARLGYAPNDAKLVELSVGMETTTLEAVILRNGRRVRLRADK